MRSLAHLQLAAEHNNGPVRADAYIRVHGIGHLFGGKSADLRVRGSGERCGLLSRYQGSRGLMDRGADARIGPAPTEVPAHPRVDRLIVRSGVGLEQRHRGQRLPRLAVAALHDVASVPRASDGVDDRTRRPLDRRDSLPDGALGWRLTGLLVPCVDQDGARCAETGSAPELRPPHAQNVPQHPEQRGLGVAVVDLDFSAIDGELHERETLRRSGATRTVRLIVLRAF